MYDVSRVIEQMRQYLLDTIEQGINLDEAIGSASLLKAQCQIQKSLHSTLITLHQHPKDERLPLGQATRIKRFFQLVFLDKTMKYRRFQELDCDILKLCGLSFTANEFRKLDDAQIQILLSLSTNFAYKIDLPDLLHRVDVEAAVDTAFHIFRDYGIDRDGPLKACIRCRKFCH